RPAPGRRQARGAAALRLPETAGRATGVRRLRRYACGRADDAGLLPQRIAGAAHRRTVAAAVRGAIAGRGRTRTIGWAVRVAPRLPGRARHRLATRAVGSAGAVRDLGPSRGDPWPAFAHRPRAGRSAAGLPRLRRRRRRPAPAVPRPAARRPAGPQPDPDGAPGRAGALDTRVPEGLGP